MPITLTLAATVLYLACGWIIFEKAGKAGWESLVPIYNFYVALEIVGRPGWWLLLMLVPIVNIIVIGAVGIDFARSFGRSDWFGIGLAFLGFIFYPLLAFGDDVYLGPSVKPDWPNPR